MVSEATALEVIAFGQPYVDHLFLAGLEGSIRTQTEALSPLPYCPEPFSHFCTTLNLTGSFIPTR